MLRIVNREDLYLQHVLDAIGKSSATPPYEPLAQGASTSVSINLKGSILPS